MGQCLEEEKFVTWSINIVGHGPVDQASASCWYSAAHRSDSKSASYSGTIDEVASQARAFIRQCQAEDVPPPAPIEPPELEPARISSED